MEISNIRYRFYDYFPHVTPMRLRTDFGLAFYEQCVIRDNIQKIVNQVRESLLYDRRMNRIKSHDDKPEQFDETFYTQLKEYTLRKMSPDSTWDFLDALLKHVPQRTPQEQGHQQLKLLSTFGNSGLINDFSAKMTSKKVVSCLFQLDIQNLTGKEINALINTK